MDNNGLTSAAVSAFINVDAAIDHDLASLTAEEKAFVIEALIKNLHVKLQFELCEKIGSVSATNKPEIAFEPETTTEFTCTIGNTSATRFLNN